MDAQSKPHVGDHCSMFWLSRADEWSAITVPGSCRDSADAGCARSGLAALSSSELEVLKDAADGLTVNESAVSRTKSPATVKAQRASVLAKLDARNTVHAVAIMAQHNLYSATVSAADEFVVLADSVIS
jgi:DNA-binding NarL/FixJ family response regulator